MHAAERHDPMQLARRGLAARAGFTLTELMVAVGILIVVVAAVMQSFVVQNRAYTVVDQVTEAQQSMRAVAWMIERDARLSGFMVPEAAAFCGLDSTGAPDTLWFTDADAIDPDDQVRASLGAEVTGWAAGTGLRTLTVDSIVVDGDPFYDVDGDAVEDADFQIGAGVILINADNPVGVACGIVDDVVAPNRLDVDFSSSIPTAPSGDRVLAIPAHVYTIGATAAGEPILARDGITLALDVEDLQVALFFDEDGDGLQDAPEDELPGSEAARQAGVLYEPDDFDNRDLREVRLNLVVRTRDQDREHTDGMFQATENRAPVALTDGFRRRVHTSTMRLRNVGFRGTAL